MRYFFCFLLVLSFWEGICQSEIVTHVESESDALTLSLDNIGLGYYTVLLDLDTLVNKVSIVNNQIELTDLEPATIYDLILEIPDDNGQFQKTQNKYITKSLSSGEIRIYFNNDADETFSDGPLADGESGGRLEKAMVDIIDDAVYTIDMCSYNTNANNVINALIDAYNRGVIVRLIVDVDQNNIGLESGIPFPVLRGSAGQGIMHNKFIITDREHTDLTWVQTGSTNYTFYQITEDPNHIVLIQDQSLAEVYTAEFEEMWGGSGEQPVPSNAKFGSSKEDNTPHNLDINGIEVQSYFSPSDDVAERIIDRIDATKNEIDVGMLIFTRREIGDALVRAHNRGVDVKVMIENEFNSLEIIEKLETAGIPVYLDNTSLIYHHKYAIIDEGYSGTDAYVITGSKNWTFSGDTYNDENTLIFKDDDIANIFRQEYQARWKGVATSINYIENSPDFSVYTNNDLLTIKAEKLVQKLFISNIDGSFSSIQNLPTIQTNISHLNTGIYIVVLKTDDGYYSQKIFID